MNMMNQTTTKLKTMPDWTKNFYYDGLKGIYFNRILNKIIKIGNLKSKKVLDFGCGTGTLKKKLGNNIINYDIIPSLSEVKDWKTVDFHTVVSNEVFHYMTLKQLKSFLNELKQKNKNVEIIVGLSRQNILTKIGISITGKKDAHDGILLTSKNIMEVLLKEMKILDHTSVFGMCDIYVLRFR